MTLHIEEHINHLLYHHECVIISGLGAFIAHSEETKINPHNDYFEPNKKSFKSVSRASSKLSKKFSKSA